MRHDSRSPHRKSSSKSRPETRSRSQNNQRTESKNRSETTEPDTRAGARADDGQKRPFVKRDGLTGRPARGADKSFNRKGGKPTHRQKSGKNFKKAPDIRYQKSAALDSIPPQPDQPERIAKYLARQGIGSRRDVERFILEGRIRLEGAVLTSPACLVNGSERIEFDGKLIGKKLHRPKLWLYHKAVGLMTTHKDPEGRPTVFDALPEKMPRVISVGRLDLNSEGLLLLTNDGNLARHLELPDTGWKRSYRVRIQGKVSESQLERLKKGITVEGIRYRGIEAEIEHVQNSNMWLNITLSEGKNREIRKIMTALNVRVNRLIRISYGPFLLEDLPKGHVKQISATEMADYGLLSLPASHTKSAT